MRYRKRTKRGNEIRKRGQRGNGQTAKEQICKKNYFEFIVMVYSENFSECILQTRVSYVRTRTVIMHTNYNIISLQKILFIT